MTALDQAFIKAFAQQDSPPPVLAPLMAAPAAKKDVASVPSLPRPTCQAGPLPPLSASLGGVWAALERPLKAPATLPPIEDAVQAFADTAELAVMCEDAPQCPTPEVSHDLKAAWHVESFTLPKVCQQMIQRAPEQLDRLGDSLLTINAQGPKVFAIGGRRRGEGATTLLLCVAQRLAQRGVKLVLVDADLVRPRLAKRLGVQPQVGWNETDGEAGHSLGEALVEESVNHMALLPRREPSAESASAARDGSRLPTCLKALRSHYGMVLVDLGPLEDADVNLRGTIDALLLVHNDRITSDEQLGTIEGNLSAAGISVVGIVENFVAE